jgi:hypothetical protein
MQHVEQPPSAFPWRAAAIVVGAIAAIELVVLIGIGGLHFAPRAQAAKTAAAKHASAKVATAKPKQAAKARRPAVAPLPTHPLRPRMKVRVLVLNGNGVQGAASSRAANLQGLGYRIGGAENAQRHNYARSMVLYVPGWVKEARRFAHDTGVRLVAPVDGLKRAKLRGSKIVLILGS